MPAQVADWAEAQGFDDSLHAITLMQKDGLYQWRTKGGDALSPTFSTQETAEAYARLFPLLTGEEWEREQS